jgi:hypothetical protein
LIGKNSEQAMKKGSDHFFSVPLGSSSTEVINLLGRPEQITPHGSEQQWDYEKGRFVLTFSIAGSIEHSPRLIRIARRIELAPITGDSDPNIGAKNHSAPTQSPSNHKDKEK